MNARELLIDTYVHLPAPRVLEDLSSEIAERKVAVGTHSIAEIVAHLAFWQDWFCTRCEGTQAAMAGSAAEGWPVVEPGSWERLRNKFLAGLERAANAGATDAARAQPVAPALEFPPIAHFTVGDALVHVAQHNAHHLGQVILLRQLMGRWPPAAGGLTW